MLQSVVSQSRTRLNNNNRAVHNDRQDAHGDVGHRLTNVHTHIFLGMLFMEERVAVFSGHPGFPEGSSDSRIHLGCISAFPPPSSDEWHRQGLRTCLTRK